MLKSLEESLAVVLESKNNEITATQKLSKNYANEVNASIVINIRGKVVNIPIFGGSINNETSLVQRAKSTIRKELKLDGDVEIDHSKKYDTFYFTISE